MASIAQLIVKITADSDSLTRGIAAAQRATLSLTEKLDAAGGALTRGLTVPLGGLAALSLRSASQFQQLERGLAAVTKEAGPLTVQMERLKKVAELPGLGFREAVQGSINLQAAGFSAKTAERALASFGNALATVGKGRAELDGVILALSQIQSKGKVSAEEINQLAERLPQIRQALKGAFNTADSEEIQKLGLSTDQVIERIIQQFEKLPPVAGGLANSFENLKDRGERALAALGTAIVPVATSILNALDPIIKKVGETGEAFGKLPAPVQNATLGLLGVAIATGPVLKLITYLGELRVAALAAYGALAKLPISFAALGGAAAVGAGAYVLLDTLNAAATKTSTTDTALRNLNQRLNETSQIAAGDASNGLSRFADSVFKATGVTKEASNGLQQALTLLKNPAASTTAKELSDALETVRAAYKRGETDLKTLSKATTDYRRDAKALGIELKQLEKFDFAKLVNKEIEDRWAGFWKRAADATVGAIAALRDLDALKLDNLGPVAAGEAITKSFKEARASVIDLIASTTTLQANLDLKGGVPIKVQPIEVDQRKGTVLEGVDILGSQSSVKLQQQAELAGRNLERVVQLRDQGKATQADVLRAQQEYEEASLKAAGQVVTATKSKQAAFGSLAKQVSTIVTDLSRGITDLIFNGGKVGDVFKGIGLQIAQSITRYAIEGGVNLLIKSLGKLLGSILDVGGAFSKVFGGAASAAGGIGSAAGGIGSAVGGIGGAAGGAGGTATSALSSTVGLVGAIGSAVTAVFSGLQYLNSRRMEQDIGRIEVTSRGIFNDLANLRRDEWDRFNQYFTRQGEILNAVRGIYDGLSQINFAGAAGGGGGALNFYGPVTIGVSGPNASEVLKSIARELKAQDNRFAR